ncbi:MAG: acyl-CoA dehydrogenase family protein [Bdellovibrionales bacterium]|nr:acyl-CoA dehydrogenase family protein [Bdellovibrionales bacterium]
MVDFSLTDEQTQWRNQVRKFTQEEIIPRTDLDIHGHFPKDLYQKAFEAGLITAAIPKTYGGQGRSYFELILAAEELGYGDLGVATSTMLGKLSTASLLNFGTEDQKTRWIVPMTKKLTFSSHCWTEPEGSSNLVGRPATTTAKPVPGGFLLNGAKSTISNATVASVFTVFARMNPGPDGLTCFVVPRDAKGVEVTNPYKKMGQRAADTGRIDFHDVFVPEADMIGKPGQGTQIGMRAIRASRVGVAAMGIGVSCRARDLAKVYGHSHFAGDGKALIQQQDFRFQIAEMEAEIEMLRALTWRACWEVENGPEAMKLSSSAKWAGGEIAVRITNRASEMLGAMGYLESGLAEKLIRDAKVLTIYEGPGAVQKMLIADVACRLGAGLKK